MSDLRDDLLDDLVQAQGIRNNLPVAEGLGEEPARAAQRLAEHLPAALEGR